MQRPLSVEQLLALRAGAKSSPERELALYAQLPAAKQALVAERLGHLDAFLDAKENKRADLAVTLEALGVQSTRSLYRLLKRMEEMGPVAALAPTPGAGRKRRADADSTLSKEAMEEIRRQATGNPHQPISRIVARVKELYPRLSASVIRRRATLDRRAFNPILDATFGREWLLDQAALRIPICGESTTSWLRAAFLIDMQTRIVVGRSVVHDDRDLGMDALLHALGRIDMLLRTRLEFATAVSEITWSPPADMPSIEDAVIARGLALSPPIRVRIPRGGKFRRGSELSALMGAEIGHADILVRATADPTAILDERDPPARTEQEALAVLDQELVFEHRTMSRWALPYGGRQPSVRRVKALRRLARQLVDVFEPALTPEQLARARELSEAIGVAAVPPT